MDRSQDFYEGAENVREPQFRTIQQSEGPRVYRRTSTLDNILPTGMGNGMGSADKERYFMGIPRSQAGQSEGTYNKSILLNASQQSSIYSKTFG